jgi:hypothetical protein
LEFRFAALLQPILHGLTIFSSKEPIIYQLNKNPKFCLALVHRVTEAIISLQERSGGVSSESFRSQGALYYASVSLLHLIVIIVQDEAKFASTHDWIGRCCAVIPCLWESRDVKVRAIGFQVSLLAYIMTSIEK